MKYTNILAGVFGLMALAACSNNDEVIVEQPKEVHTITVAYGRGANTRLQSEEDWKDYGEFSHLAFKSSWEDTDQIKLVAEDETEYVYSIETINADGTATFTREGKPADGTYKVVYPASWDGSLGGDDDYVYQEKTSLVNTDAFKNYRFDIKDYQYAMAIAECTGGNFGEIALKPIFNFLYIPEDLEITNMELYDWTNVEGLDLTKKLDNGKIIFDTSIGLTGTNLYKTIKYYDGIETGSLWIRSNGKYESWPVFYNSESKKWQFEYGTLVAFPVLPGQEPVKNLQLWFYEFPCNLKDAGGNDFPFTEGGHVYNLEGFNLVFPEPEVAPEAEPAVGKVVGSDGKFYATVSDAEAAGTKGEAMIAFLDEYEYIAIALEDVSAEPMLMEGTSDNNKVKEAIATWANSHKINGDASNWFLPIHYTWENMFKACGSETTEEFNNQDAGMECSYGNFRKLLTDAGGTDVKDDVYWGYAQTNINWGYDFKTSWFKKYQKDTDKAYVRAAYGVSF